jgi:hypothetical protein
MYLLFCLSLLVMSVIEAKETESLKIISLLISIQLFLVIGFLKRKERHY